MDSLAAEKSIRLKAYRNWRKVKAAASSFCLPIKVQRGMKQTPRRNETPFRPESRWGFGLRSGPTIRRFAPFRHQSGSHLEFFGYKPFSMITRPNIRAPWGVLPISNPAVCTFAKKLNRHPLRLVASSSPRHCSCQRNEPFQHLQARRFRFEFFLACHIACLLISTSARPIDQPNGSR